MFKKDAPDYYTFIVTKYLNKEITEEKFYKYISPLIKRQVVSIVLAKCRIYKISPKVLSQCIEEWHNASLNLIFRDIRQFAYKSRFSTWSATLVRHFINREFQKEIKNWQGKLEYKEPLINEVQKKDEEKRSNCFNLDDKSNPEKDVMLKELKNVIEGVVDKCSKEDKILYRLYYTLQMDKEEVCKLMKISDGAFRTKKSRLEKIILEEIKKNNKK